MSDYFNRRMEVRRLQDPAVITRRIAHPHAWPYGIAIADDGLMYVSDNENSSILVFDTNKDFEYVREWGRFGVRDGSLSGPDGLYVNGDELFVGDNLNHRICVFNRHSGEFFEKMGSERSTRR